MSAAGTIKVPGDELRAGDIVILPLYRPLVQTQDSRMGNEHLRLLERARPDGDYRERLWWRVVDIHTGEESRRRFSPLSNENVRRE